MAVKDITLGQFYPVESAIHRLDPRTKIIGTLAYLVSLFCVKNFSGFLIAAVFLTLCIWLSKVPVKFIFRGLKAIIILIIFTAAINIIAASVRTAAFMAIRLILLILGSSLLTLTTKPITLTDGLERLFSPLSKIGLPTHELAMMISIALRFIPTLMDETDKIMKAQSARGANFETGKLKDRAKALIPLLVPLFVSAFRIASDLAMAMEARCYHGGNGRTRMNRMKLSQKDLFSALILCAYFAVIILLNKLWIF